MQKKVPVPDGPDLPVQTPPKRLLDAFPESTTTSDSEHEVGDPETVGGSDMKREIRITPTRNTLMTG